MRHGHAAGTGDRSKKGYESDFVGVNELSALGLTDEEEAEIVAFLRALEGPGPDPALLTAP
jgi:hypothetical protein